MILLEQKILEQYSERAPLSPPPQRSDWLRRLRMLAPEDRMLVEMAMDHRLSRRQMGAMLGVAPGNVTRRIRRLVNRLHDPIVVALTDPNCSLADEYLQFGLEHFLLGRPLYELARKRSLSWIEARAMIEYIRGWQRGSAGRRTSSTDL